MTLSGHGLAQDCADQFGGGIHAAQLCAFIQMLPR